jgi:hypothetical protein
MVLVQSQGRTSEVASATRAIARRLVPKVEKGCEPGNRRAPSRAGLFLYDPSGSDCSSAHRLPHFHLHAIALLASNDRLTVGQKPTNIKALGD